MRTTARLLPADAVRAFQPTADRGSLWLTGQYDDALRTLRTAVLGRQGLLVLVGEGGTGKSVLAHALVVGVREDAVVVGRLLYPILEGMDLLAAVAEAFGLPSDFQDRQGFVAQLRHFVAETTAAGRRVLLVVDEAQRLNNDLLIELGRLPHDGGAGPATLSVLLVGQRGVLDALRAAGVEPDVLCHLRPLTREQTAEYVAHRLRTAGNRGRLFTPSALRKIWVVSDGIPRAANALCIAALDHLRQTDGRTVTAAMVDRPLRAQPAAAAPPAPPSAEQPAPAVVSGTTAATPSPPLARRRRRLAWVTAAAAVALSLGAAWGVTHSERIGRSTTPPVPMTEPTTAPTVPRPGDDAGAAAPAESASVAVPAAPAEHVATADLAGGPVAGRTEPAASAPALATPLKPRPQRRPETVAPPRSAEDGGDASAVIDWLLKGRRTAGGIP
jgi:type II secretory pathway predicted ATPase ExeA